METPPSVCVPTQVRRGTDRSDQAVLVVIASDVKHLLVAFREYAQSHPRGVGVDVKMLDQGDDELQLLLVVHDPDGRGAVKQEVDVGWIVFTAWKQTTEVNVKPISVTVIYV